MNGPRPSEAVDVFGLLEARARIHPGHVAARTRRGGAWEWTTWGDLRDAASAVALSLIERGVGKGDAIALMASTREEWTVTDFAIVSTGAVTVPIHPTATAEQLAQILHDSSAVVAVVGSDVELAAVRAALPSAPSLRELVVFDRTRGNDAPGALDVPVTPYAELVRAGRARLETTEGRAVFDARRRGVGPGDLATIVFTSGTGASPRGVMLTHGALLSQTRALLEAIPVEPDDEQLLSLPLAHIFARILVLVHVASGSRLAYSEGPQRLSRDLGEVEPTFFATVPRFLEKAYAAANESARTGGPLKAALFTWAVDVGKRRAESQSRGREPKRFLAAQARYADKLALARVRSVFGRRLRFVICGAAPLARELAEWLLGCGVTVLEGYGLTELGGASHVNRPGRFRFGTVGQPLRGYAARLAHDGEVLLSGPSSMKGYAGNAEATRLSLDDEGWLHTGDIGRLDGEGYLTIVARKRDVIVTAGGRSVAPQRMENLLLESPWIHHAVVLGDHRPYLVALLTLDESVCRAWARERQRPSDVEALSRDPELAVLIQLDVDGVNRRLASFETIERFSVLPRSFSKETGELTELGKLRRDAIRARYAHLVESLYARRTAW